MASGPETVAAHVPAHNWGWFMLRGVLALLLGVAAILFPWGALFAFTAIRCFRLLIRGTPSNIAYDVATTTISRSP